MAREAGKLAGYGNFALLWWTTCGVVSLVVHSGRARFAAVGKFPRLSSRARVTHDDDMRFTQGEIDELKKIYREEFGNEITDDAAAEIGSRLIELIRVVIRASPPPQLPSTKLQL